MSWGIMDEVGGSQLTQLMTTSSNTYLGYQNFGLYNPGKFFYYPYLIPSSPLPQAEDLTLSLSGNYYL